MFVSLSDLFASFRPPKLINTLNTINTINNVLGGVFLLPQFSIVKESKQLVREGTLSILSEEKRSKKEECYVFLLDDVFIITKKINALNFKVSKPFKYVSKIKLIEASVEMKDPSIGFTIGTTFGGISRFFGSNDIDNASWFTALDRAISAAQKPKRDFSLSLDLSLLNSLSLLTSLSLLNSLFLDLSLELSFSLLGSLDALFVR